MGVTRRDRETRPQSTGVADYPGPVRRDTVNLGVDDAGRIQSTGEADYPGSVDRRTQVIDPSTSTGAADYPDPASRRATQWPLAEDAKPAKAAAKSAPAAKSTQKVVNPPTESKPRRRSPRRTGGARKKA